MDIRSSEEERLKRKSRTPPSLPNSVPPKKQSHLSDVASCQRPPLSSSVSSSVAGSSPSVIPLCNRSTSSSSNVYTTSSTSSPSIIVSQPFLNKIKLEPMERKCDGKCYFAIFLLFILNCDSVDPTLCLLLISSKGFSTILLYM